jgi:hypothetical protein
MNHPFLRGIFLTATTFSINVQQTSESNLSFVLAKNILRSLRSLLSHFHLTTNELLHLDQLFITRDVWILSNGLANGFSESFVEEQIVGCS